MENVSWKKCQAFINKLNAASGRRFSLPTEAQWEFAARGGVKSRGFKYSGSDDIDEVAWYSDNSDHPIHDVATKQANELGIYDMSGNVWEWCNDRYGDYRSYPQTNPTGAFSGWCRILRGGASSYDASCCRSSYRKNDSPDYWNSIFGLRLALSE